MCNWIKNIKLPTKYYTESAERKAASFLQIVHMKSCCVYIHYISHYHHNLSIIAQTLGRDKHVKTWIY